MKDLPQWPSSEPSSESNSSSGASSTLPPVRRVVRFQYGRAVGANNACSRRAIAISAPPLLSLSLRQRVFCGWARLRLGLRPERPFATYPSHLRFACELGKSFQLEGSMGKPLWNAEGEPYGGLASGSFGLSRGSFIEPIGRSGMIETANDHSG